MKKTKTEHLALGFEVKDLDTDSRTFSGLAATWDLDLGGDVIKQGAFKKTLRDWKKAKRSLPLLDSHNGMTVRSVVGKMIDGEETVDGLLSTFEMIDGPDGDEVFRRIKGGFVDGLSIGYRAIKVAYPDDDEEVQRGVYRYLKEVALEEVSVCLWPMNPNARIDAETAKAMLNRLKPADQAALLEDLKKEAALLDGAAQLKERTQTIAHRARLIRIRQAVTGIEASRHRG